MILTEQIEILEQRIQEDTQAKFVCRQMQYDGVQFASLDSKRYLEMLTAPMPQIVRPFRETVNREYHPWRRYFARMLDYRIVAAIFQFVIVVLVRIRPFESNAVQLLNFASHFIAVPVFAVLIHSFGTTPGKWAMGIRLENVNGERLSGGEALYREGKIVWHGLGFFLPLFTFWRMYRSYKDDKDGNAQCWNEDTEIIYTQWSAVKKCVFVAMYICSLLLSVFVAFDTYMPTFRGDSLTVSQFSQNHQDYENIWDLRTEYYLGEKGTWQLRNDVNHGYYVIGEPIEAERPAFTYELDEKGNIIAVSYENNWENADFQSAMPSYCCAAIDAIIGSRPGSHFFDIIKIDEYLESELYSKLPEQQGSGEGAFIINDVTVSWQAEIENCKFVHDGLMLPEDNEAISYNLKLKIKIG